MDGTETAIELLARQLGGPMYAQLNDDAKNTVREGAKKLLADIDYARTVGQTLRDVVDPSEAHRAVEEVFERHEVAAQDQPVAWWATRAVLDLHTSAHVAQVEPQPSPAGYISLSVDDGKIQGGTFAYGRDERYKADEHSKRMTIPGSRYSVFRTYKIVEV